MTYEEWQDWLAENPRERLHRDQVLNMANKTIEHMHEELGNALVDRDNALRELAEINKTRSRIVKGNLPVEVVAAELLAMVCRDFNVQPAAIKSLRKTRHVTHARHVFCWLARKVADLTLTEIGEMLRRDHSTVLHAVKVVESGRVNGDPRWKRANRLLKQLEGDKAGRERLEVSQPEVK